MSAEVTPLKAGEGLFFVKVGTHAHESLSDIVERKKRELLKAGVVFWGYGGSTCHPRTFVQPFAMRHAENGKRVLIVMEAMDSTHFGEQVQAREYSIDGLTWEPVPPGVVVMGSRFAAVLSSLEDAEFDLDLTRLRVGQGMLRGKSAGEYLQGTVDKGCFEMANESQAVDQSDFRKIALIGEMKAPYAVFLR